MRRSGAHAASGPAGTAAPSGTTSTQQKGSVAPGLCHATPAAAAAAAAGRVQLNRRRSSISCCRASISWPLQHRAGAGGHGGEPGQRWAATRSCWVCADARAGWQQASPHGRRAYLSPKRLCRPCRRTTDHSHCSEAAACGATGANLTEAAQPPSTVSFCGQAWPCGASSGERRGAARNTPPYTLPLARPAAPAGGGTRAAPPASGLPPCQRPPCCDRPPPHHPRCAAAQSFPPGTAAQTWQSGGGLHRHGAAKGACMGAPAGRRRQARAGGRAGAVTARPCPGPEPEP